MGFLLGNPTKMDDDWGPPLGTFHFRKPPSDPVIGPELKREVATGEVATNCPRVCCSRWHLLCPVGKFLAVIVS